MRVLVVDDERRARERLTRLLRVLPEIEVVGHADNGVAALDAVSALRPDAMFLDVQMPGLTGFDVVSELPAAQRPWIVFVTAYDRYAVQAFETSAVDYLVKPVTDERLRRAVANLHDRTAQASVARLVATLQKGSALRRIAGRHLHTWHVLPVEAIEAFVADQELVFAITETGRFLVNTTLRQLEERLDTERFARVHKRAIVNLEKLAVVEPIPRGGATARLRGGQAIEISRRYAPALRQKLGW